MAAVIQLMLKLQFIIINLLWLILHLNSDSSCGSDVLLLGQFWTPLHSSSFAMHTPSGPGHKNPHSSATFFCSSLDTMRLPSGFFGSWYSSVHEIKKVIFDAAAASSLLLVDHLASLLAQWVLAVVMKSQFYGWLSWSLHIEWVEVVVVVFEMAWLHSYYLVLYCNKHPSHQRPGLVELALLAGKIQALHRRKSWQTMQMSAYPNGSTDLYLDGLAVPKCKSQVDHAVVDCSKSGTWVCRRHLGQGESGRTGDHGQICTCPQIWEH